MNSNKTEKEVLATRAVSRAKSALNFLDECLECFYKGETDFAYSRSMYILMSYSFELILKSRLLLASNQTERESLIKEIKSHDLRALSRKLSENELRSINIKSIQRKNNSGFIEYIIEMIDGGKVVIQDLIDVRYDFEKDNFRKIESNEPARIKGEIDILYKVVTKITEMLK
jgi:hypothetical protein